jgi:hypothetical protein
MVVVLDDGSKCVLGHREVEAVYDQLWLLADHRGSISAAGKLKFRGQLHAVAGDAVRLNERESAAFRVAHERAQTALG